MLKNERGLTLIEVLLSTLLLGIILATFMNFFPQMARWNHQNTSKNQAVNLAKTELVHWKSELEDDAAFTDFKNTAVRKACTSSSTEMCFFHDDEVRESRLQDQYKVEVIVWEDMEIDVQASKIRVKIIDKKKNRTISDTYGYIFAE